MSACFSHFFFCERGTRRGTRGSASGERSSRDARAFRGARAEETLARRRGDRGASTRVPRALSARRILSSTSRERRVHPDPNPERRRARAMRAACGVLGCASAILRHSTRCRTPSSNARAPPRAFAAVARRAAARATGVGGRDSAVSRREKVGTPKGTHRDDGEARVRDARRGGGRAELRAGEGPGEGKPRHVEKTRHSSSGVLRTRVRAQVPRETCACDARRARRGFSLLLSTHSFGVRKLLVYGEIKPSIGDSFFSPKILVWAITAARALRSGRRASETRKRR